MAAGKPLTRSLYNDIQEIEWLRRERSASAIHSRIIGGRVPQVKYSDRAGHGRVPRRVNRPSMPSIGPALILAAVFGLALPAAARTPASPRELGLVRWGSSLEAGLAESRKTGRPVLLLFQEIPGCATCVEFGAGPLSSPLLVDAIESEFVPVAVHNNRPGADAEQLARFGEPACNFPVLRVLDTAGRDLLPRRGGIYGERGVADRLVAALAVAKRPAPGYLELAREEAGEERETAAFAMGCYWEGEATLGALEGVVATRTGFLDGEESVELSFDPRVISYPELVKRAAALKCATVRSDETARAARRSDQEFYLGRSTLRFLPLTPLQATRVNASLGSGVDPARWLSPRQRTLAGEIDAAFRREPGRFARLERPASIAALPAYERDLGAALARAARAGG